MLVANLKAYQKGVMASQVGIEELHEFSRETSAGEDLGWAKAEGGWHGGGCPTATTFWSSRTETIIQGTWS